MRNTRHWSDEDLLHHLYGVGPQDGHLERCMDCAERWHHLAARKAALAGAASPADQLVRQRERILARVQAPERSTLGWRTASALATLAVVAGGLFLYERPSDTAGPIAQEITDAQLLTEVSRLAEAAEPAAAAPMRQLFEEN